MFFFCQNSAFLKLVFFANICRKKFDINKGKHEKNFTCNFFFLFPFLKKVTEYLCSGGVLQKNINVSPGSFWRVFSSEKFCFLILNFKNTTFLLIFRKNLGVYILPICFFGTILRDTFFADRP